MKNLLKLALVGAALLLPVLSWSQPRSLEKGYRFNVGISYATCTDRHSSHFGTVGEEPDSNTPYPEVQWISLVENSHRYTFRNYGFIETVHGYSDGQGLFLGGGIGVGLADDGAPYLPLYAKLKYNFNVERRNSPFASLKVGGLIYLGGPAAIWDNALVIAPGIGLDFGRFTVELSYEMSPYAKYQEPYKYHQIGEPAILLYRTNNLKLGVFYNF